MLNDLFRTYKKIIIIVVLLLSAVIFWFFGCHRSGKNKTGQPVWKQTEDNVQSYEFNTNHITGNITFGTGGRLSADRIQPVVVNVSGKEEPFAGTIKITLPGDEGKGVAYQSAINCEKGYSSRIVLSIPKLGNVSFFSVEILDQYGAEELAEMIIGASGIETPVDSGEVTEKKTVYIGVLSDEPDKLQWLDDLEIVSGQTCYVCSIYRLKEMDLLGEAGTLQSLSGILIDDYDTSSLSMRQRSCLKEWVETEGGCLLIGTGSSAKTVLSGLGDLIGASPGEDSEESLQFYHDDESTAYVSVRTNQLKMADEGAWKTEAISFPVSCYQRSMGRGLLTVITWSLTDEALQQWTGRERLTGELIDRFIPDLIKEDSDGENNTWYIKKTLYSFLDSQTPNTFYYALFFIVYLSVLGFFSYYILRRIRKREYIWGIIPAISLLFTVCLVIRSRGFGGNVSSSYSALEIIDSADSRHNIFFMYQNNEGESNSIDLVPAITYVEPLDYSYRTGDEDVASLRRLKQDYTINNTKNGFDIAFEETVPGTSRLLRMVKTDQKALSPDCFEADLEADHTSFYGTITNSSLWDFERVLLIRGNQYAVLYNVKSGEKKQISREDIMCWSDYDQENVNYRLEEKRKSLTSLEDYVRNRFINSGEDFNTVVIAGITSKKGIALLSDRDELQNQQTIFINRHILSSEDNIHYISDINKECLSGDSAGSSLSADILEEKKTKATYQFDRAGTVWGLARNRDSFTGTIYAYNYWTGKDEAILDDRDDFMDFEELEPYISDMNKMTLTYRMKDTEDYGPAPILTALLKDVN